MKDARSYIRDFDPAVERLEALIERVQRDAFTAGMSAAGDQMFEIVEKSGVHIDELVREAMDY